MREAFAVILEALEASTKEDILMDMLDGLCKLVMRDIFIMMPEGEHERMHYLIKEIGITLDRIPKE